MTIDYRLTYPATASSASTSLPGFTTLAQRQRSLIRRAAFEPTAAAKIDALNITEDGFGFSVQVLIQTRKKGFIIKEVPITCLYHSQGSSLNPVAHGLGVAFTVVKLRLLSQ